MHLASLAVILNGSIVMLPFKTLQKCSVVALMYLSFVHSLVVFVQAWGGVVSVCRLRHCFSLHTDTTPPQPNHNLTPTHIEPEQYNPRNNSTNKSQAPED